MNESQINQLAGMIVHRVSQSTNWGWQGFVCCPFSSLGLNPFRVDEIEEWTLLNPGPVLSALEDRIELQEGHQLPKIEFGPGANDGVDIIIEGEAWRFKRQ